ncbi:hypothetical protein SCHPADRAFT_906143 [Schizopora paradoxa]|uniref:Cytochrome c-type biogenesis protein H TPR domain-containing protein n=1 Tax=Schizopora paradoxa TaxID=27342 RepID=A0A0H2S2N9_9AGAM|nr:hypothetical protein SCHPADRAFT_906143 [Schizopora paradoxa]
MSLRHTLRQPERERDRDVRMHDHLPHLSGPPPPPPPAHGHPVHMNGSVPSTPAGLANGHAHPPPPPPPNPHGPPPPSAMSPGAPPPPPTGPGGVPVGAGPGAPPGPSSNGGPHANGGGAPVPVVPAQVHPAIAKLTKTNEETWLLIGSVAENIGDLDRALSAYENALRHNPHSLSGLTQVAGIARIRENYVKAIDYFQRVIALDPNNGEVWSALGHCFLMQDDLQKAYTAYQQALYLLPNPKEDPKLWYGIGILYDRYGSLDHAEEAFASVLQMDKVDFDKANEILFRLGIIYKQQGKYQESLECFDRILRNPPNPLAHADIWFQIGHVYEQQKDHIHAKEAYERVVQDNPHHAKVLQQLGWLYHQDGSSFQNQDLAITYLTKSLEADSSDAQSWYLLGRAYMAGQKYNKAYEAYQQAVYRDGRNPTFWCSIGVLYFQINQYRDALDAYSRAIRINPYISEVWFDLGSLYESCNNQISDAIDAYARASELDPGNHLITQRLQLLRQAQATGGQLPAAPGPQDVHPTAYASAAGPPTMTGGMGVGNPPMLMHSGPTPRSIFSRSEANGARDAPPEGGIALPSPHPQPAAAPPPYGGGPPPPVVLDDSRRGPAHTQLAPMEVDRPPQPPSARDAGPGGPPPYPGREQSASRGPAGHQSLLLHHQQTTPRQAPPPPPGSEHHTPRDPAFYSSSNRERGQRRIERSPSMTPPPQGMMRGPPGGEHPGFHGYPPATNGAGARGPPPPGGAVPSQQRSPRYPRYELPPASSPPPPPGEHWDDRRERGDRDRGRQSTRPRGDSRASGAHSTHPYGSHVHSHSHSHSLSRPGAGPASPMSAHPYDGPPPPGPPHSMSRRNTDARSPPPPLPPPSHAPGSIDPSPRSRHLQERSPITGPGAGPDRRWGRYGETEGPSPRMTHRQHSPPVSPHMSLHGHGGHSVPPQGPPRRYDPIAETAAGSRDRDMEREQRERDRRREYEERERERAIMRERELERDAREREKERERDRYERESVLSRSHAGSPELYRSASVSGRTSAVPGASLPPPQAPQAGPGGLPPPPPSGGSMTGEFPSPYTFAPSGDAGRGRARRGKEVDVTMRTASPVSMGQPSAASSSSTTTMGGQQSQFDASGSKDRKRRRGGRKGKDDGGSMTPSRAPSTQPPQFKVAPIPAGPHSKSPASPEPISSASVSSGRSGRPSPTVSGPPRRDVDEDYDEGVAGALMSLAQGGQGPPPVSPTALSMGGRQSASHRGSISSAEGARRSPTIQTGMGDRVPLKRPLSPGPGGEPMTNAGESKRSRVDILNPRRMGSPAPQGRHTPQPSTPIPFRLQPTRSPEDARSPTTTTSMTTGIPQSLPLPPPPSAVVASSPPAAASGSGSGAVTLPPIATLSTPSSPTDSERMQVDQNLGPASKSHSRSVSPPRAPQSAGPRSKVDVMNPSPTSAHSSSGAQRKNSGSAGSPARSPPTEKNGSPRS